MKSEKILGIDLGTTNSCVAVLGEYREAGDVFDGVTVITTPRPSRLTIPSVVAIDPETEQLAIGHRAKNLADEQPAIMFAKRRVGTDEEYRLAGKVYTPRDISAQILLYLKKLAEDRLGQPVDRAVISVPNFFNHAAKRDTREAGEKAGLHVAEVLLEPVAASLMYTRQDICKELRILVFDLGGGTFDAAVVDKRGATFQVLGWDGSDSLGGYDFDKALAYLIVEKLVDRGYKLSFDIRDLDIAGSDEDRAKWYKLLLEAEKVKMELSEAEQYHIRKRNWFEDKNGEPIDVDIDITRRDFEGVITGDEEGKTVNATIGYCHRAIRKARTSASKIDEIIMVGGSCYIPIVQEMLENEFGLKPKLVRPDLCVAIGDAIRTQAMGEEVRGNKFLLHLDHYPKATPDLDTDISGVIEPLSEDVQAAECTIGINNYSSKFAETQRPDANGNFYFRSVELKKNSISQFDLAIMDGKGEELLKHSIKITQNPEIAEVEIEQPEFLGYIAKPFYIDTISGLVLLAEEGEKLEYEAKVTRYTATEGHTLIVDIYEEDRKAGEIEISGLENLPKNTEVTVTLRFTKDYTVEGEAYIPNVNRNGTVKIQLPRVVVKELKQLREEYQLLKGQYEEAFDEADKERRMTVGPDADKLCKAIDRQFDDPQPERAEIAQMLLKFRALIRRIRNIIPFRPTWKEFTDNVKTARRLLAEAEASNEKVKDEEHDKSIDVLEQQSKDAFEKGDTETWAHTNRQLDSKIAELDEKIPKVEYPPEVLAPMTQRELLNGIGELRKEAERDNRLSEFDDELTDLEEEVIDVDVAKNHQQAIQKLVSLYITKFEPLAAKITGKKPSYNRKTGVITLR